MKKSKSSIPEKHPQTFRARLFGRFVAHHIPVNDRLIKLACSSFNVNELWLRHGEGDMLVKLKGVRVETACFKKF